MTKPPIRIKKEEEDLLDPTATLLSINEPPPHADNERKTIITLTAEQAIHVDFPIGCPVWYHFSRCQQQQQQRQQQQQQLPSSRLLSSSSWDDNDCGQEVSEGVVASVSMDILSRKLIYKVSRLGGKEITIKDGDGMDFLDMVEEDDISFGLHCPVKIRMLEGDVMDGEVIFCKPLYHDSNSHCGGGRDSRIIVHTVMMHLGENRCRVEEGVLKDRLEFRGVGHEKNFFASDGNIGTKNEGAKEAKGQFSSLDCRNSTLSTLDGAMTTKNVDVDLDLVINEPTPDGLLVCDEWRSANSSFNANARSMPTIPSHITSMGLGDNPAQSPGKPSFARLVTNSSVEDQSNDSSNSTVPSQTKYTEIQENHPDSSRTPMLSTQISRNAHSIDPTTLELPKAVPETASEVKDEDIARSAGRRAGSKKHKMEHCDPSRSIEPTQGSQSEARKSGAKDGNTPSSAKSVQPVNTGQRWRDDNMTHKMEQSNDSRSTKPDQIAQSDKSPSTAKDSNRSKSSKCTDLRQSFKIGREKNHANSSQLTRRSESVIATQNSNIKQYHFQKPCKKYLKHSQTTPNDGEVKDKANNPDPSRRTSPIISSNDCNDSWKDYLQLIKGNPTDTFPEKELGVWLKLQLALYRNTKVEKRPALCDEKIALLEEIGVSWNGETVTTPWDSKNAKTDNCNATKSTPVSGQKRPINEEPHVPRKIAKKNIISSSASSAPVPKRSLSSLCSMICKNSNGARNNIMDNKKQRKSKANHLEWSFKRIELPEDN